MRRYEVAVRSRVPVTVPGGACCACGRGPADGVPMSDQRHRPFWHTGVETLVACELPLCHGCADSLGTRDAFVWSGAGVAAVLMTAGWAAGWWARGVPSLGAAVIDLIVICGFALAIGGVGGRLAGKLVGLVRPGVWMGNHVAHSVKLEIERPRRGMRPEERRTFFRFSSEEYARAFAAANASILLPARGRDALSIPAEAEAPR